ncbi:hypothetical protein HK405_002392, partial [Cladochytrium tenue]
QHSRTKEMATTEASGGDYVFEPQASLDSPVVRKLITALNAELTALNSDPAACSFSLTIDQVIGDNGVFLVAFPTPRATAAAGPTPGAACGAIRILDEAAREGLDLSGLDGGGGAPKPIVVAEVKRMYVAPEYRRRRLATELLVQLVAEAGRIGATHLVLETGRDFAAAVGLYERFGFRHIPLFGEYLGKSASACLAMAVVPPSLVDHSK